MISIDKNQIVVIIDNEEKLERVEFDLINDTWVQVNRHLKIK